MKGGLLPNFVLGYLIGPDAFNTVPHSQPGVYFDKILQQDGQTVAQSSHEAKSCSDAVSNPQPGEGHDHDQHDGQRVAQSSEEAMSCNLSSLLKPLEKPGIGQDHHQQDGQRVAQSSQEVKLCDLSSLLKPLEEELQELEELFDPKTQSSKNLHK